MKFSLISLALLMLTSSFVFARDSCRVYALLTIDTLSQDINVSTIADKMQMNRLLTFLSGEKIEVQTSIIEGKNISATNIQKWAQSLQISPEDTIFFYYSGHGRQSNKPLSPWPLIAIERGEQYICSEKLFSLFESKQPRLLIMMTDCCNNQIFIKGTPSSKPLDLIKDYSILLKKDQIATNLSSLFQKIQGTISLTASKPGYTAGATDHGGIMTQAFLKGIASYNKKRSLCWFQLIKMVRKETQIYGQEPYYKFSIKKR